MMIFLASVLSICQHFRAIESDSVDPATLGSLLLVLCQAILFVMLQRLLLSWIWHFWQRRRQRKQHQLDLTMNPVKQQESHLLPKLFTAQSPHYVYCFPFSRQSRLFRPTSTINKTKAIHTARQESRRLEFSSSDYKPSVELVSPAFRQAEAISSPLFPWNLVLRENSKNGGTARTNSTATTLTDMTTSSSMESSVDNTDVIQNPSFDLYSRESAPDPVQMLQKEALFEADGDLTVNIACSNQSADMSACRNLQWPQEDVAAVVPFVWQAYKIFESNVDLLMNEIRQI
jgi:hypothetical protein